MERWRPFEEDCLTIYESVTDLEEFETSWGRMVRLQELEYEGGLRLLRVRIREGQRFTDLELSPDMAEHFGKALLVWADLGGKGIAGPR